MNNLTNRFLDNIYNVIQVEIPDTVFQRAKQCFLDYLGVTLAGSRILRESANKLLDSFSIQNCEATIVGLNRHASVYSAALINGILSHTAELDDGERVGMIHLGAPIISALLPLAEREKANVRILLSSIIIGYEAAATLASIIQPSHKDLGYHATGTCGSIGAAIGAAFLLGFTKEQVKNTISAAVVGASGILEVMQDDSELKPFNVGKASLNALIAVDIARVGFKGPSDILGGKRGFFAIMSRNPRLDLMERAFCGPFKIEKTYTKPYAACRHSHSSIEAVLNIRSRHGIRTDDVKKIEVYTYKWAVHGHDHTFIEGVQSAKMSIPFAVAVAMEYGKAGISEFCDESISEPRITSLTTKVHVIADDNLTSLVPEKRVAIVNVITNDGRVYTERVDLPKGEPENPLSKEELEEKFISLAMYGGKTMREANLILRYVWNIEESMSRLLDLL